MEVDKKLLESSNVPIKKPNYMLMSLQRIFVLIILLIAVVVVVYYTPMPEAYFENCDRQCNELDWPMICRIKLVVEVYKTLSKSCGNCTERNGGDCPSMCISADGRERGILSVNRELPAPSLHVCENDILVIDVVHRAPAHALTMHWRGQPQKETPFMDGAPMLTQCPQPAYTTFQYKFRASAPGTHMYHAHSAADAADGLAGTLVVRQAPRLDTLKHLYDIDATEHTIFIAEWGHSMGPLAGVGTKLPDAESLLINGKGKTSESPNAPLSTFEVEYGKRYRFRLAYGGGIKSCSIKFSIDQHVLKLVALDGNNIETVIVENIVLGKGERADFILEAKNVPSVYKIQVLADKNCQDDLRGSAKLVYKDNKIKVIKTFDEVINSPVISEFSTVYSEKCNFDNVLCLNEVHSKEKLPLELAGEVQKTIFMPLYHHSRQVSSKRVESWGQADGHRFTYPESPLLTQGSDVDANAFCSSATVEGDECVHVRNIPLHSSVELIMFDQGGDTEHIFHLHGYSFYVVGIAEFDHGLEKEEAIKMHQEGNLFAKKNLVDPVLKDTIIVPKFGAVALRFKANNPGYWMMRDERSSHWTRGFDFVLKVGEESDFVQAPVDFPRCGSYVGPEYFLI